MDDRTLKVWFVTDTIISILGGIGAMIMAKLISLICWANWPEFMADCFLWCGHDILKVPMFIGAYMVGHNFLWWHLWEERMLTIIMNMRAQK